MENKLSQLAEYIPTDVDWASVLDDYIPAEVNWAAMLKFIVLFAAVSLVLGFLGRMVLGKRSGLNHALSSAMGIACIYAVTVVIYSFNVTELSRFLTPLPYVAFSGDYLLVLPFHGADLTALCSQVVSMVILAFLVNLLDTFIPKGESVIGWYLLRFVTVGLAMAAHYVVTGLLTAFLPDVLVTYAPVILLGILAATLLLGLVSLVLGFVVSTVNPILGALTTFLFHNVVGKQLSKAVLTTMVLTAVFYLLEHFGYTVILIAESALVAYIPLIVILLVLWYLIGHIL